MATVGIPSVAGEQLGGGWSRFAEGIERRNGSENRIAQLRADAAAAAAAAAANDWGLVVSAPSWLLAVLISVGASAMTVTGFVMQKRALQDASAHSKRWPRVGDIVLSPNWVVGFLVTAIFPVIGDLLAYSLAPLSLTAPLSGISVVLNMVIAPRFLQEQLQRFPDLPATLLILLGCLMTTVFGDHDHVDPYGADKLLELARRPAFLCGSALGACCGWVVVSHQRKHHVEIERFAASQPENPHLPHVLLPALAAALCGAVANVGLKGIGELLKHRSPVLQVVMCVLVTAPSAAVQVNFINRGLVLYPQSIFISVYGALLVLTNTIYGALFYEEYLSLLTSRSRLFFFASGCALIMSGIGLFRFRRPSKDHGKCKEDGEEIGLLSMDADEADDSMGTTPPIDADGRRRLRNTMEEDEMI